MRNYSRDISTKAELSEFLGSVGWRDIIEPALDAEKARLKDSLVQETLSPSSSGLSPVAIAGRVAGIEWVKAFIIKTINSGLVAEKVISSTKL